MTVPAADHIAYRPDIDGLRAVAVLSVLLFHAWPGWLPGGFVGVDIFFVISGFLITSIIQKQVRDGTFTIANFYARRVRRIFPALAIVLLAVSIFGWVVLLPGEFRQVGQHITAGAGFVANIALWNEVGYFDSNAESKPLLHLWSLGIEEQFYIFWPLLIWGLWSRQRVLRNSVLGLTAVSLLASIVFIQSNPAASFFLPFTRLWELALGGIAAHVVSRRLAPPRHANLWSLAGAVLIAASLALINPQRSFPGWWALLPVMGAFSLVLAGPSGLVNRHLLALRPMVWVGLISYPLYLWHWPLLSYAVIVWGEKVPWFVKIVLLLTAAVLSAATYWSLERPIRNSPNIRGTVSWLVAVMSALAVGGVLVALGALPQRIDAGKADVFLRALNDRDFPGPAFEPYRFDGVTFQRVRGSTEALTVFIGDSMVEHYGPRIEELARTRRADINSVVFATGGGCPPIPGIVRRPVFRFPSCGQRTTAAYKLAHERAVVNVVIGAGWYGYLSPTQHDLGFDDGTQPRDFPAPAAVDRAYRALAKEVQSLVSAGKRVFIVLQPPTGRAFDPRNMYSGSRFDTIRPLDVIEPLELPAFEAVHANPRRQLIELARDTGAFVIDPAVSLCANGKCPVLSANGSPLYTDAVHMRPGHARSATSYLDQAVLQRGSR